MNDPDSTEPTPPAANAEAQSEEETKATGETETKALTPEEQMARYEEALKEEDWGHQPC